MHDRTRPSIIALAVTSILACSSSPSALPAGAGGVEAGAPVDDATAALPDGETPSGSFSVTFGPVDIPPGTENTQCIVVRLGNPAPLHVGRIHDVLGTSSHHMIVYKVTDTVESKTPFDCKPFTETLDPSRGGAPLIITQKKDDLLELPPGVAYTLDADQMVRIEMHYINPSVSTTRLTSTSTMTSIADDQFVYEAGFLFLGDPDIRLDPHQAVALGPKYMPLPSDYADVNFYAITGHEHKFGTSVVVGVASGPADPGTQVYDVPGWLWDEPKTVYPAQPFVVPAGGGFRLTCSWMNSSDNVVTFGESANDEMCFFWAYYYPNKGPRVCFHTEQAPGVTDFCCPGSSSADQKACAGFIH